MDIYSITNASGEMLSKIEVEELLKEMGISEDAILEGTTEAIEEDAQNQGITNFDEQLADMAKQIGAKELNGSADKSKENYKAQLIALGIPSDIIDKGESAIKAYAAKNGIKLPNSKGINLNIKS